MTNFTIDSNIPISGAIKYPFGDMNIGDSFFAPNIDNKNSSRSLSSSSAAFRKRYQPSWDFSVRSRTEDNIRGARIWRIENNSDGAPIRRRSKSRAYFYNDGGFNERHARKFDIINNPNNSKLPYIHFHNNGSRFISLYGSSINISLSQALVNKYSLRKNDVINTNLTDPSGHQITFVYKC